MNIKNTVLILSLGFSAFTSLFLSSPQAHAAQLYLESNGFYFSDGLKVGETTTNSRMLLDLSFGFTLDRKAKWQAGWNYSIHSASATGAAKETYSSTEMGPKIGYYFDKNRNWGTSFTYNLIVTGSYKAGDGATQNLRGTSMRFDVGYGHDVSEQMRLGVRMVYNMATFAEEVDDTTLTKVSYSRTFIYPAFSISYLF